MHIIVHCLTGFTCIIIDSIGLYLSFLMSGMLLAIDHTSPIHMGPGISCRQCNGQDQDNTYPYCASVELAAVKILPWPFHTNDIKRIVDKAANYSFSSNWIPLSPG